MSDEAHTRPMRVQWHQRAGYGLALPPDPGRFTVGGALSAHLPLTALLVVIPLGALLLASLTVAQAIVSGAGGRRRPSGGQHVRAELGRGPAKPHRCAGHARLVQFLCGAAGFAAATLLACPAGSARSWSRWVSTSSTRFGLDRWNSLVWVTRSRRSPWRSLRCTRSERTGRPTTPVPLASASCCGRSAA